MRDTIIAALLGVLMLFSISAYSQVVIVCHPNGECDTVIIPDVDR